MWGGEEGNAGQCMWARAGYPGGAGGVECATPWLTKGRVGRNEAGSQVQASLPVSYAGVLGCEVTGACSKPHLSTRVACACAVLCCALKMQKVVPGFSAEGACRAHD
jgi:hypothetical protein